MQRMPTIVNDNRLRSVCRMTCDLRAWHGTRRSPRCRDRCPASRAPARRVRPCPCESRPAASPPGRALHPTARSCESLHHPQHSREPPHIHAAFDPHHDPSHLDRDRRQRRSLRHLRLLRCHHDRYEHGRLVRRQRQLAVPRSLAPGKEMLRADLMPARNLRHDCARCIRFRDDPSLILVAPPPPATDATANLDASARRGSVNYMVDHICEPILSTPFASSELCRPPQDGGKTPLTFHRRYGPTDRCSLGRALFLSRTPRPPPFSSMNSMAAPFSARRAQKHPLDERWRPHRSLERERSLIGSHLEGKRCF